MKQIPLSNNTTLYNLTIEDNPIYYLDHRQIVKYVIKPVNMLKTIGRTIGIEIF